ncbi:MAG: Asp-tRNA(Asn)/Glu-tRNA(Gln) amidotransferase subunit GatC [Bacillota bacterium]|nr:Asp-tRNA(Asn)/Glu-tRNA(Gln) amidotransferase subunit GatC [Bacillota bacterium]
MPAVSASQVRHVAALARLSWDERSAPKLVDELNEILAYISKLSELDTAQVPPTSHALDLRENVLREDEPRTGLTQDEALADAPDSEAGMFRVPRVVGGQ